MLDLRLIEELFPIENLQYVRKNENGLINHSYTLKNFNQKFILQQVNTSVFNDWNKLESNYRKIIDCILLNKEYSMIPVQYILANSGQFHVYFENKVYRLAKYIEHKEISIKDIDPNLLFEIANKLGEFQYLINNGINTLDPPIPNFIDFNKRIYDFQKSLKFGRSERIEQAKNEIEFLIKNAEVILKWNKSLSSFQLVNIHGDPKWNNFLFNSVKKPISIIDWDTLMPGYIHYDFGDLVRSSVLDSEEDDIHVKLDMNKFTALYEGYKASKMYNRLNQFEKSYLMECPLPVIYIQAVRFITDYLNGDIYYQIKYPSQNLNKAKSQISLFKQLKNFIEKQYEQHL